MDEDLALSSQDSSEEAAEADPADTVEVVEVSIPDRPLMSTPLDDYSVTEGLLLVIFLLLLVRAVFQLIGRWL